MATYTLFGQSGSGTLASDTEALTLGVQFSVSEPGCTLTGIWWYSASGSGTLPEEIALYAVSGGTLVHSETPSWSGAAGSGWVRASFSSPPSLASGTAYVAVVWSSGGFDWYSGTHFYWSTGPGSGGVTDGALSAPDNAASANGQCVFDASGPPAFPAGSFDSTNYWADPEVTLAGGIPHAATASLTVTPSFSAAPQRGHYRAAGLAVTPSFTAHRARGRYRAASLTVAPSFSAGQVRGRCRRASLTLTPSFTAPGTRGRFRGAALQVAPSFTAARLHGHGRIAALVIAPVLSALRQRGRHRACGLTVIPGFTVTASGGTTRPGAVFSVGDSRWKWSAGSARN